MSFVEYKYTVNWGDTDAAGIVFYPNFYRWMDQASHHFFSAIGYPSSQLFVDEKIGLPLLEAKCEFKFPLRFEDEVCIRSSIIELRDKVFKIRHEFLKNGIVIANGYEVRAWADFSTEKIKAISIPEKIRNAISYTQTLV
ncbi:acyl-CoA thioesterase [Bacillus arachidis]|uniref:Acyl-CoA thioesterase n=1 Tax=Bacillus arachidis TaxID=2819290 RepID=A0ABS3P0F7_9BACI|nr:thioesterase family protein [Bacillus arachidis]MBO1626669.1 acyl-CoA thioesterase [Bacillus arachidis]